MILFASVLQLIGINEVANAEQNKKVRTQNLLKSRLKTNKSSHQSSREGPNKVAASLCPQSAECPLLEQNGARESGPTGNTPNLALGDRIRGHL